MQSTVYERHDEPGVWAVERIDMAGDGDCYVSVFYGPRSEQRARAYADIAPPPEAG